MQHLFLCICLFIVVCAKMACGLVFKVSLKSVIMFWPPARKMRYVITQIIRFIL